VNKRFKAELGVQDCVTREQRWYIMSADEREDVIVGGKKLLQIGDHMFAESELWRYSRAHAVRDLISGIESVRDALSRQIEEIKKNEGVL